MWPTGIPAIPDREDVRWLDWFVRHRPQLVHKKLLAEGRLVPRTRDGTEDMLAALAEKLEEHGKVHQDRN
jgi:hypothetical protein